MKTINWLFVLLLILSSCKPASNTGGEETFEREVVVDSIFNDIFFPRGESFTGADGVYSTMLPDGRSLWTFGDTFLGNVTAENRRIKTDPLYIRNCFLVSDGESFDRPLRAIHQGEPSEYKSMMIPPEVADGSSGKNELEIWYWPGDAFVEDDRLFVFVSKFSQQEPGMWGFRFERTELIEYLLPDFIQQDVSTFENLNGIHFGHAVCQTAEYTYIYGLMQKNPYVARVKRGEIREDWEFFSKEGWSSDVMEATPILDFSGSEQFSVFEWGDQYIMIMQAGDLSTGIHSFVSDTPYGPWINKTLLYETPLPEGNKNLFTYNALAHPQFTVDDMLLISFNTNSMVLQDHYDDATIYRPRFIRVPFEMILGNGENK